MRPHVLWFDEMYSEELYRSESALKAAEREIFYAIGTTGATSLPAVILKTVAENGGTIIDINPEATVLRLCDDLRWLPSEGPKRCFLAKANGTCRVSNHALSRLLEDFLASKCFLNFNYYFFRFFNSELAP